MHSGYHSLTLVGQFLQKKDHLESSCRVKTCCWLIQKNNTRVCDELNTNRSSFPLTTTDPLD